MRVTGDMVCSGELLWWGSCWGHSGGCGDGSCCVGADGVSCCSGVGGSGGEVCVW